jgi:hypothetical protein
MALEVQKIFIVGSVPLSLDPGEQSRNRLDRYRHAQHPGPEKTNSLHRHEQSAVNTDWIGNDKQHNRPPREFVPPAPLEINRISLLVQKFDFTVHLWLREM